MTKTINKKVHLRFSLISVLIVLAALSRLIPHPPNVAPIAGMALFGAAYYSKKYWAYLIPIVAMWVSDLILNNVVYAQYFDQFVWFYSGSLFTYGAFALIVLLGTVALKKKSVGSILFSALSATVIFFIVSNFGVWLTTPMYAKSWVGLTACYAAAIPFLQNSLLGNLGYTALLFGLFELSMVLFPELRISRKSEHQPLAEK